MGIKISCAQNKPSNHHQQFHSLFVTYCSSSASHEFIIDNKDVISFVSIMLYKLCEKKMEKDNFLMFLFDKYGLYPLNILTSNFWLFLRTAGKISGAHNEKLSMPVFNLSSNVFRMSNASLNGMS